MVELILQMRRQDHIVEAARRIARAQHPGKIATWSRQRGRSRAIDRGGRTAPFPPLPRWVSQSLMAFFLLCGAKLHGKVEKTRLVTLRVALDQAYKLLC